MEKVDERHLVTLEQEAFIPDRVDDLVEFAEKRVKWVNQVMQRSIGRLAVSDVVSMSGKPYITATGAFKIARLWGVKLKYLGMPQKSVGHDDKGDYYIYMIMATVSIPTGDSVDVIGTASSRDKFFAWSNDGGWKEQSAISEEDIIAKCVTTADRRGIMKLLGISTTWDDLLKFANIKQQDVQSFSFKKPAQATRGSASKPTPASDTNVQSEPVGEQPTAVAPPTPAPIQAKSQIQKTLDAINLWRSKNGKAITDAVFAITGKKSLSGLSEKELIESEAKAIMEAEAM